VLVRAEPATRAALGAFPPEAPGVAALSRQLRERFDPRGVLNPGLMAAAA
jgi:glycolate oxidase FAD binding subunit